MRPDAGRIIVDGVDLTRGSSKELEDFRQNLGVLFQSGALFDYMRVSKTWRFHLTVILSDMRTVSGELAGFMQSERARLHETVADLRSTAAELDAAASRFNRVADQGGDSLIAAMNQMNDVMRRLDRAAISLEGSSASLQSVVKHVASGEGSLGKLVYDVSLYARLDTAAMRLDSILNDFQENPGKYLRYMDLIDIF